MQITMKEYATHLSTFYVYGCAVRDRTRFGFIADRWFTDEEVEAEEKSGRSRDRRNKHLVTFFRNGDAGKQWGSTLLEEWATVYIGAATKPQSQFIALEMEDTSAYVIGSGVSYMDTPVQECKGSPVRRGSIFRIKMIEGYAYVCGGNRSVGKRLGKGEWFSHSEAIPKLVNSTDDGFDDIAGFNENDLYAVGGKGDVWHYNGKTWQQVSFPTNIWTTTVCCGGDGNVYISCYEGLTFMGRENRWKKIYDGGISLGFKDMVWHEGKVWCTNDNGVWTIENGKLARASGLPSEIYVCSGSLSVNDGVMLMAGLGGAAFMENGQWHNLFLRGEMEMAMRKSGAP
ncbi:hypothetical protein HF313_11415 [Massilia atriviolacea]|uniref:Uncharacterized protein n=1 Tax=Massilia atriviolacea TaxID=2495579 RepID=A0A430HIM1_9BURK|nr:hypothetical protein [Massilia atriviolacea]RSZ57351.1 hypothetical protein EJB06_19540 [Massilia atriviolacea]